MTPESERAIKEIRPISLVMSTRCASLTALTVVEVPVTVPMDAHMIEEETEAKRVLDLARAIAHGYGVSVSVRVVRARDAGEAIVEEARRANTEIIHLEAPRSGDPSRQCASLWRRSGLRPEARPVPG